MATEFKSEDTDLESWIDDGVSFLQAEVTIYRNPAIFAKYDPIMNKIRTLENEIKPKKEKRERGLEEESVGGEQAAAFTDESLGDSLKSEVQQAIDKAYEEAEKLWAEYSKDCEVWTLRRLNEEEVEEERKKLGEIPVPPEKISSTKASHKMRDQWAKDMEAWSITMQEYNEELHTICLSKATMKIVVKGKTLKGISVDGVRRLKVRPGGDQHFKELKEAMTALTVEGVSIMAPHRDGAGA